MRVITIVWRFPSLLTAVSLYAHGKAVIFQLNKPRTAALKHQMVKLAAYERSFGELSSVALAVFLPLPLNLPLSRVRSDTALGPSTSSR